LKNDYGMGMILNSGFVGFVQLGTKADIAGWIFASGDPDPVTLSLFVDGLEAETRICETPRVDVVTAGFGRQNVGFRFDMPDFYCDGAQHRLELRLPDGTVIESRDADGAARLSWLVTRPRDETVARLDSWRGRDVHCWAYVVDRLTGEKRPADHVTVRQAGQVIATLRPEVARPDIADQFESHYVCGFMFSADRLAQLSATAPLHFFVTPDGREMPGSPLNFAAVAEAPAAALPPPPAAPPRLPDPPEPPLPADAAAPPPAVQAAADLAEIGGSGLFDEAFYLKSYPDVAAAGVRPLEHFMQSGWREGRLPNLYFDPVWYLERNPDAGRQGGQPLLHYLREGDALGCDPGPWFDAKWYRSHYEVPPGETALAHYLRLRFCRPLSPQPDFDAEYYAAAHPDVWAAKVDMFDHFFKYGYTELRNPSAEFDVKFYIQRYLNGDFSVNPLVHYRAHKGEPGVYGRPSADEVTVSREVRRFCRPGPLFEELQASSGTLKPQAMLLAYYLPQYHSFAENDAWWGKGFTEWTNLARGSPRFVGHYQPRIPRDLGFYSLNDPETMRRQIKLALASGVSGFVFYYYWFNGKRLMDGPVNRFLADKTLDIKFALMWANENWTRKWDGADADVLISQGHRPGDDLAMVTAFAWHFADPRYIRLQGRPLLMIYRPGIIPDTMHAVARWRELFRTEFNEDPIFVMAQAFGAIDPRAFGFDGAIEFPPHKLTQTMVPANAEFTYLDQDFTGAIHRYDDVAAVSVNEAAPEFPLIKTIVPSWDNDARRQGTGMAITGSTPQKYEAWLSRLVQMAQANPFFGTPVVCVNAWNEWCEGAYLEPDLHFGGAYLNATARAMAGRAQAAAAPRLVLVGHDAFPSGAQHLLLNIGKTLRAQFGIDFAYVLLGEGEMAVDYAAQGPMSVAATDAELAQKLRGLAAAGFTGAIVNTVAAARAVDFLRAAGIRPVLLVHEMPRLLREKHLLEHARQGIAKAQSVVFSSAFAQGEVLREIAQEPDERMLVMPQGCYQEVRYDPASAARVRAELGLGEADHMILGAGYADMRKGFDLFLQIWRLLRDTGDGAGAAGRICLVWAGGIDPGLADWLGDEMAAATATGTFKMAGYRSDMAAMFSAASAFALTSREDPLPTVVMEALAAGVPVLAFERSGGIPDLLRGIGEGMIVPFGDAPAMARGILATVAGGITQQDRVRRHGKIAASFGFADYVRRLAKLALPELKEISVVVPNYNYAAFLPGRLGSIFQQSYPVREVLVLDDASRDDSVLVIPQVAREAGRMVRLVVSESNSGSVFRQWRRAAELAAGEFIWIAEADDESEPAFLSKLTALLAGQPDMVLAFSDSRTVLGDGSAQWESYKEYYGSVEPGALRDTAVFEAPEFVRRFMAVKNLILNVSAVVWRREALLRALDDCGAALEEFRLAGDWLLYLTVLATPGALVGYEAQTLNIHRRHEASVTHALDAGRHVAEIARCQAAAAALFELPPAVLERQAAYQAEVAAQLAAAA
jgi:glycosyltransferase involved in cell wall biosynthesis